MPPFSSNELVRKMVEQLFPDAALGSQALVSLERRDSQGRGLLPAEQLVILKISEGRLWELRELVREAKKGDIRDIFLKASSPSASKHLAEISHIVKQGGDIRFIEKKGRRKKGKP